MERNGFSLNISSFNKRNECESQKVLREGCGCSCLPREEKISATMAQAAKQRPRYFTYWFTTVSDVELEQADICLSGLIDP
jgi:hypothetical protein